MPEYNFGFSETLITAADAVRADGLDSEDAQRTVLYLSLLACEIAMKSLLEKAGMPIRQIRQRSHHLGQLLDDVSLHCEINTAERGWMNASAIRGKTINLNGAQLTLGKFMEAEKEDASHFPNQIRYGETIRHYPPEAAIEAAKMLTRWSVDCWDRIRFKS